MTAINVLSVNAVAEAASWSIQTTPNPAEAREATLRSVSCPAESACIAAGFSKDAGGTLHTLAERWNGREWQILRTPDSGETSTNLLAGVSCKSEASCIAVGGISGIVAERWDGRAWALDRLPLPRLGRSPSPGLTSVSCSSETACTAVGYYRTLVTERGGVEHEQLVDLAERWNGTEWEAQAPPNPAGARESRLNSVSCSSARSCTAIGEYFDETAQHRRFAAAWNGSEWRLISSPTGTQELFGVSCTTESACTAIGGFNTTVAQRWNGREWTVQTTQNPGINFRILYGLACTSETLCTAAGYYVEEGGNLVTLVERWNGTEWVTQTTPNPTGARNSLLRGGVSCTSERACTAVGVYVERGGAAVTLAERYA